MRIWRITGDKVGPDDCGADYFENEKEALAARDERKANDVEMIEIITKRDLMNALKDAMGYGGS